VFILDYLSEMESPEIMSHLLQMAGNTNLELTLRMGLELSFEPALAQTLQGLFGWAVPPDKGW
jgi:hypothetical protein